MGVNNVSFDEAMTTRSAAGQYLRSKEVSAEEKGQLSAKWGAEFVNGALSVDSTKYEIDDEDYKNAKEAGKDAAKDATGYDGGKTYKSIVNAGESVGASVGAYYGGNAIAGAMGKKGAEEAGKKSLAKNMSDVATAILTSAVAAKYFIAKPNKDQHKAGEELLAKELPTGQSSLNDVQDQLEKDSEEITKLTEEAEEKNEDANNKIEEDKTLFDFQKQQQEALKVKKDSGEALTADEKALLKSLTNNMQDLGEDINTTSEETSGEVNDINDNIGEYQDSFDESAETIAQVEGVTDFAEGFDENSRTMMYVEAAGQGVNALSAGIAAAKLWAKNGLSFGALTPFAVMATAAGIASTGAAKQQVNWAGDMSNEIHARRDTQELGSQTNDKYDEELENYAGNVEVVEDLELEVPDDMEVPQDTTEQPENNPAVQTNNTTQQNQQNDDKEKNDKKNDDQVK